jgi:hypothetical protein
MRPEYSPSISDCAVSEPPSDLPIIELVTESSWISGRLAREQASDLDNLVSLLNLGDYGLRGRSLIESGRLVDVLNRDTSYISVNQARIQPLFPIDLLDRTVESVAVNMGEILCAAPLHPDAVRPASPETNDSPPQVETRERRLVELQVGPILVRGDLHIMPGSQPVAAFFQRDLNFVPLTNATAIYLPEPNRKWVREVLIVNMRRTQVLFAEDPDEEDRSQ